jgi:hypothetical protein
LKNCAKFLEFRGLSGEVLPATHQIAQDKGQLDRFDALTENTIAPRDEPHPTRAALAYLGHS